MKTQTLRSVKATLSAVVEAAARGEATTITRHGRAAAMIVPIEDALRLYPAALPNFAALLLGIPEDMDAGAQV